jgi:DNA-binding NtrC family response regulator
MPRVLLVDDEPAVLRAYGRVLASLPVQLKTAASAADALAEVDAHGSDIVITDHDMPGQSGVWLLQEVRARLPGTKRILMSGRDIHDIEKHLASGLVHRFLAKPIDPQTLRASVWDYLAE